MASHKSAYLGLDELSKNVSKDRLIQYILCLIAGTKGNGSIASKLDVGANRIDVLNSWLLYANLISEEGILTQYGVDELKKLKEMQNTYVLGLLDGDKMRGEREYFLRLEVNSEIFATINTVGRAAGKSEEHGDNKITSSKTQNKRTRHGAELRKAQLLYQIKNGGLAAHKELARGLGISKGYLNLILYELKKDSLIDGWGNGKHLTDSGIEKLNMLVSAYGKKINALSAEKNVNEKSERVIPEGSEKPANFVAPRGDDPQQFMEDMPEVDKTDLLELKFLMGVGQGLDKSGMEALFKDDGGVYLIESSLRRKKLFLKNNGHYELNEAGNSKLGYLKSCYGESVLDYTEKISGLREKLAEKKIAHEPKIMAEIKQKATKHISCASEPESRAKTKSMPDLRPDEPAERIAKETDSPQLFYPIKKPEQLGTELLPEPNALELDKDIAGTNAEISGRAYKYESEGASPEFKYVLESGCVKLNYKGTTFDVLEIKNMWEPEAKGKRGMKTKITPEVILLEILKRSDAKKDDITNYVEKNYPDWESSLDGLYRKKFIKEGENGFIVLTDLSRELTDDVEMMLYRSVIDDFDLPEEFDFSARKRHVESHFCGTSVLIPAQYVIGSKIREFKRFEEYVPEERHSVFIHNYQVASGRLENEEIPAK